MKRQVGKRILYAFIIFFLFFPNVSAAEKHLISIPPFYGQISYSPLFTGLQQVLIDDLNILLNDKVMKRKDMVQFLNKIGKGPNENIFIFEIQRYNSMLNTEFIVENRIIEKEGMLSWDVKLLNGLTGNIEKKWFFKDKFRKIFNLKDQVVSSVLASLSGQKIRQSSKEGNLSAMIEFSEGIEAFDNKNYPIALLHFREALKLDKDFLYAKRQLNLLYTIGEEGGKSAKELGLIFLADEKPRKSEEFLFDALRQDRDDVDVLIGLSQIDMINKDYLNAKSRLLRVRDIDQESFSALIGLSKIHIIEGKNEEAIKLLEKAKSLSPENPESYKILAQLYERKGSINKAVAEHKRLARIYARKLKIEKAYEALKNAERLDPDNSDLLVEKEEILKKGGWDQETFQSNEKTNRLSFANENLNKKTKSNYKVAEDVKSAKNQYEKALQPKPDKHEARIHSESFLNGKKGYDNRAGLIRIVESFPHIKGESGLAKVAIIDIDKFIEKDIELKEIINYLRINYISVRKINNVIKYALEEKYFLVNEKKIQETFDFDPYNSMSSLDLKNRSLLFDLCLDLNTDALIFYKIMYKGDKGLSLDAFEFNIYVLLFEKGDSSLWETDAVFFYPKDETQFLNKPLIISIIALLAFIAIFLIARIVKGTGDLRVLIEKDPGTSNTFFSIVVSKKVNKDLTKTKKRLIKTVRHFIKENRYTRKMRYKRYEHSMVLKDAVFKKLQAREYYVYLYGIIQDIKGEQIGNYQMTQKVIIEKNKKQDLIFDLRTSTSHVEIEVFYNNKNAIGAEVAVKGMGDSKYIKDEKGVFFRLPVGTHILLINYNGELYTKEIKIPNLEEGFTFRIDLSFGNFIKL